MNLKRNISLALLSFAAFVAFAQHPTPVHSYLEIYDLDSGTHKVIKEFDYVVEAPDWTPDGQWLVFNSGGKLYKMAPCGCSIYHLTNSQDASDEGFMFAYKRGERVLVNMDGSVDDFRLPTDDDDEEEEEKE